MSLTKLFEREYRWGSYVVKFPEGSRVVNPGTKGHAKPHVILDGHELKHCAGCNTWRPINDFSWTQTRWDSSCSYCHHCVNASVAKHYGR